MSTCLQPTGGELYFVATPTSTDKCLPARIPALDGIRGLAIALVLARHLISVSLEQADQLDGWKYTLWYWIKLGGFGVDLFFVLSGFLITRILLENQNSPRLFRAFYLRRCCRILPLYFSLLFGVFLLHHFVHADPLRSLLFGDQYPWASYLTFTQNFAMAVGATTGGLALAVTWSLAVEEQFYLGLPWVIRWVPARYLPWLFASGIPWALLVRFHWNDWRSRVWLPGHTDSLLTGCLLAWVCLQPGALAWLQRQGRGLTALLVILGGGIFVINQMPEYYVWITDTWMTLFFGVLVLIGISQRGHVITKFLELRWLGFLGMISYGVYLLHFPVNSIVFWLLHKTTPVINNASDLMLTFLGFALTLALATLSWFFFEKRWVKLGHQAKY